MALISLGTLVVACKQVVVGGGEVDWRSDGWRDEGWDEHRATLTG